jgi:hypothetical protein
MPKNRRMATTIVPKTVFGFTDKFDMASGNLTLRACVHDVRTMRAHTFYRSSEALLIFKKA